VAGVQLRLVVVVLAGVTEVVAAAVLAPVELLVELVRELVQVVERVFVVGRVLELLVGEGELLVVASVLLVLKSKKL
jgi:hypothetical protein